MSDLTPIEKRKLELLFNMGSGYVLGFSNGTLADFLIDSTGRELYDPKYDYGSGSKANRLRAFWKVESNYLVGKLTGDMLDFMRETNYPNDGNGDLYEECRRIVLRLNQSTPVADMDALTEIADERDFEAVAKAVREAIEKNDLVSGLDRLHTFSTKFLRKLCEEHGISTQKEKPLNSLLGEYTQKLRTAGHIESGMTVQILKASIKVMEEFNDVRNNRSLAHDNTLLNYDEALLIFNHVSSTVRFLKELAGKIRRRQEAPASVDDGVPF